MLEIMSLICTVPQFTLQYPVQRLKIWPCIESIIFTVDEYTMKGLAIMIGVSELLVLLSQ